MSVVQLSLDQARKVTSLAVDELRKEDNIGILKQILQECESVGKDNPMLQFQMKMGKLIPKVMEILGSQIECVVERKIESSQVMAYVMQIQTLSTSDIHLSIQVSKIMKTLSGDFSGLYEEDEEEEAQEID